MKETTHTSLIATASTPNTTATQPATQQTGSASTGMPGWLFTDIPLLSSLLISLSFGTILAASIGVWGNMRLEKQRQRHGKELEDQRQGFEKERDELRRQHEIELERIRAEYESERQRKLVRNESIKSLEVLLDDACFGTRELIEQVSYRALEPYFSMEFRHSTTPHIMSAYAKEYGLPHPLRLVHQDSYTYPSDAQFRDLLMQELARLKKEWDLI
jgi:hypothetical protein